MTMEMHPFQPPLKRQGLMSPELKGLRKTFCNSLKIAILFFRFFRYVYLTGASYCPNAALTNWNCTYCKTSMGLGYTFSALLFNQNTDTLGIITINKKFKEIVVTFRGTYNVKNALADLDFTEASLNEGGGGTKPKIKKSLKKRGNKIKKAVKGKGKSTIKV